MHVYSNNLKKENLYKHVLRASSLKVKYIFKTQLEK